MIANTAALKPTQASGAADEHRSRKPQPRSMLRSKLQPTACAGEQGRSISRGPTRDEMIVLTEIKEKFVPPSLRK
jgi:hypothetical protein